MSLAESEIDDPAGEADGAQEEQFEKPRAGVYTMMLIVSFFALLIGIFCLHKEMESYDYDFNANDAKREARNISQPKPNGQSRWLQPSEIDRALVLDGRQSFDPLFGEPRALARG